jgi:regulator of protease activity HflC (stomatin/prohibitin superfamily)
MTRTAIKSKLHAKTLLRWLVEKNRVQVHMVTKEEARDQAKSRKWEFEVNEDNEQKAERKTKEKYAYPNVRQQQRQQERQQQQREAKEQGAHLHPSPSCYLHSPHAQRDPIR